LIELISIRNQPNAEMIHDGKLFDLVPLYNRLMEKKNVPYFWQNRLKIFRHFPMKRSFCATILKLWV
jgi:hypothetical protein